MDNIQLDKIIKSDFTTSQYFLGVFAADRLPRNVKYPCALIVNSDEISKPGTHWFAIFIDKFGNGEYFDSFAVKPWVTHHIRFLNKVSRVWKYNTVCLQNIYSSKCGQYCALYIAMRSRGFSMHDIVTKINKSDSVATDRNLIKMYKSIYSSKFNFSVDVYTNKSEICQHCRPFVYLP